MKLQAQSRGKLNFCQTRHKLNEKSPKIVPLGAHCTEELTALSFYLFRTAVGGQSLDAETHDRNRRLAFRYSERLLGGDFDPSCSQS